MFVIAADNTLMGGRRFESAKHITGSTEGTFLQDFLVILKQMF